MKKTSWEIIVAGLLLLIVAIVITSKSEERDHDYKNEEERLSQVRASQEAKRASSSERIRVINVEELAKIEDLHKLSELKSLEGLQKLRSLAALIPDSAKKGIISELNAALLELENDSFSISIDDNLILLQKEYKQLRENV